MAIRPDPEDRLLLLDAQPLFESSADLPHGRLRGHALRAGLKGPVGRSWVHYVGNTVKSH